MNERHLAVALKVLNEAVKDFDEDTVFAALGIIAERYDWDLTKRDPGPCCCEYNDFYERQGLMTPMHECPSAAPLLSEMVEPNDILGAVIIADAAKVIDARGRWS